MATWQRAFCDPESRERDLAWTRSDKDTRAAILDALPTDEGVRSIPPSRMKLELLWESEVAVTRVEWIERVRPLAL